MLDPEILNTKAVKPQLAGNWWDGLYFTALRGGWEVGWTIIPSNNNLLIL